MHNKPQISSQGEWGDASAVENNKGKIDYYCRYCDYKCRSKETIEDHIPKCKDKLSLLVEGEDYVQCKFCNLHVKSLGAHLTRIHNYSHQEYKDKYGKLICNKSSEIYANTPQSKEPWIVKAIRNGDDLTSYKQKLSCSVKRAINSNEKELARRSALMKKLNDKQQSDPNFQRIVSETAKKTSARKDIQEKRALQLKKWREGNPEDHYNKCVKKMITTFQIKPEKKLFEFIKTIDEFQFKKNGFVTSNTFTSKTNKRQIDIYDKNKKIYIEYDGQYHFINDFDESVLIRVRKRDLEVEEYIKNKGYTLIRVSFDQYVDRNKIEKSYFLEECLNKIKEILVEGKPGIYKIGSAYEQYKVNNDG